MGNPGDGGIAHAFASDLRLTESGLLSAVGSRSQASADRFAEEFGTRAGIPATNPGTALEEPLDSFPAEAWKRTLTINLPAPVALTRALESRLTDGSVVNIASTDSRIGSYSSAAYAASKAALVSATRSLANLPHASFLTGADIVLDGGFANAEPVLRREAGM